MAHQRLQRLARRSGIVLPADPVLIESASNDVWLLNGAVLRVCWRGDRERLAREASLAEALPRAVGYPPLLDAGRDDEFSWTLCEQVRGHPLSQIWLDLPVFVLRDLVQQLAAMLSCLHSWTPPEAVVLLLATEPGDDPESSAAVLDAGMIPLPVDSSPR